MIAKEVRSISSFLQKKFQNLMRIESLSLISGYLVYWQFDIAKSAADLNLRVLHCYVTFICICF